MRGQTNQNESRLISDLYKRRTLSQSQGQSLGSPTIELTSEHRATVITVGMIEESILYPGDSLRLGVENDGDVLLVQATHPTTAMLYTEPLFARRYGEFVILNTAHQPTIDMTQWSILGAVKGIERRLSSNPALGQTNWYIKVYGVEGTLARDWVHYIESKPLPPEYLAELAMEIASIDGASIQAAWSRRALEEAIIPTPGSIVFSFNRLETTSGFVSSWAAATKRTLRRKRRVRRRLDFDEALHPVPECRTWTGIDIEADIETGTRTIRTRINGREYEQKRISAPVEASFQSSLKRGRLAGK